MGKHEIYVLGNILDPIDQRAVSLSNKLKEKGWMIQHVDVLDLFTLIGKDGWVIIDVGNVNRVTVYDSDNVPLKNIKSVTAHDIDLSTLLNLMKVMGGKGKIIVIPMKPEKNEDELIKELEDVLWTIKRSG